MNERTKNDAPKWVLWVERQWGALLRVIHFIVTSTADSAVDIAARSMAIAAPLPNAISVYNISQKELNFGPIAALAFALVIELIGFALVEYSLFLFDGWLQSPRKWLFPFAASVTVVVVGVSIVIRFVYTIELAGNGHTIMAWLPVISLCAFVSIGLKRWHDRQPEMSGNQRSLRKKLSTKLTVATVNIADSDGVGTDSSAKVDAMNDGKRRKVDAGVDALYEILRNEFDGIATDDLNKAELGRRIGKSRATVGNYLDNLSSQGRIDLNGHVKVVK